MLEKEEQVDLINDIIGTFEEYLIYVRKIKLSTLDQKTGLILKRLNTFCTSFSQTVLRLILDDCIWESEALLRSVMEGSIKLAYIACEPELITKKVFEYSHILPHINGRKRNNRIENLLNLIDLSDNTINYVIYQKILATDLPKPDEELNKNNRKIIENRWAFNSMIDTIEKCNLKEFSNTSILSYPYGMMSYIVHMDCDGLNFMWERFERDEADLNMVNTAQVGRQLFDIYNLMFLRILSLCLIYKTDYEDLLELRKSHKNVIERIQMLATPFEENHK